MDKEHNTALWDCDIKKLHARGLELRIIPELFSGLRLCEKKKNLSEPSFYDQQNEDGTSSSITGLSKRIRMILKIFPTIQPSISK